MRRPAFLVLALALLAPRAARAQATPDSRVAPPLPASPAPDSLGVYGVWQVDRVPELRNRNDFARELWRVYPPRLRDRGVSGTATIEVVVDREGRVSGARAVRSSEPEFGTAAVRVVERMRFTPARLDGQAVPVRLVIPVTFALAGADGPVGEPPQPPIGRPYDRAGRP